MSQFGQLDLPRIKAPQGQMWHQEYLWDDRLRSRLRGNTPQEPALGGMDIEVLDQVMVIATANWLPVGAGGGGPSFKRGRNVLFPSGVNLGP